MGHYRGLRPGTAGFVLPEKDTIHKALQVRSKKILEGTAVPYQVLEEDGEQQKGGETTLTK
jgi:hypothetical protein